MPHEFSAGAVIFRIEGRRKLFLILHYGENHWDFVKGHIEKGEDDEQTVVRECQEETGISDLEFVPLFRDRIEYFYRREGKTMHKQVVFFLAKTKTKEVALSFEHIGFEWLVYEEALAKLTFDNAKKVLEKANSHLEAQGK